MGLDAEQNRMPMRLTIWLVALATVLTACATQPESTEEAKPKPRVLWPAPPELPRLFFEGTLRRPADIEVDSAETSLRKQLTGESTSTQPAFQKPGALAATHGRVYVADTVGRQIVVFDLPRRKVFRFGFRSPGSIVKPSGIALDGKANVYVADTTQRIVQVYDSLGLYLKTIGNAKELERPVGVAVNKAGTRIYVVDRATNESNQHRVVIYDGDNKKVGEIGTRGSAAGDFNVPLAAAMGPDDSLHVLDSGNFRVQIFDQEGRFLRSFGQVGAGLGNLARPRGLAIDGEGNIYVADASFGNFQIFNNKGELLLPIGKISREDGPGHFALIAGIAVDEKGHIFVADQYFNKVEIFRRLTEAEGKRLLETAE